MSDVLPEQQQQYFKLLKALPPVKKRDAAFSEDNSIVCASCSKLINALDIAVFNSGVVPMVVLPLCKRCVSDFKGCARLVCYGCKTVVGWIEPHTDKDKFEFAKNSNYHIISCPSCKPGIDKADIVEKLIYLRNIKR